MKVTLYASLTGPLIGLYYPLPFDDERICRVALNTSKLAKLWCAVYTREQVDSAIAEFGGARLADKFAGNLDYDSHAVSTAA